MSLVTTIADAVVATINASGLLTDTVADRSYLPRYDLREMQTLKVTVVPKTMTTDSVTRSHASHDITVDVAVQKKLGNVDQAQAEQDGLMDLSEQVADHLRITPLVGQPNVRWIRTEHTAIYATEHLEQMRQFTALAAITFRILGGAA